MIAMDVSLPLSIAIPTYRREQVLLSTLESLLTLRPRALEILVLDFWPGKWAFL